MSIFLTNLSYNGSAISTTASVDLYGEKTDVELGENVLLRLSAVNYITKPIMHVLAYPFILAQEVRLEAIDVLMEMENENLVGAIIESLKDENVRNLPRFTNFRNNNIKRKLKCAIFEILNDPDLPNEPSSKIRTRTKEMLEDLRRT